MGGESYTSSGIYVPFGYIEREKNGTINAGLNLGVSTPHIGPYAESGYYVEHSWEPDGSQSNGHGTYVESGIFYGDEAGAYSAKGKCWDSWNGHSFRSGKDIILPKFSENPPEIPKSNNLDDIARKVYRGEYGNGAERRRKLESEGYNYREVQNHVNKKYYS